MYSTHIYYYTIFSVEKCRDGLGSSKKIPIRPYSLQGRDTPLWYTPKIGSGQNLLSRPDPTDSLLNAHCARRNDVFSKRDNVFYRHFARYRHFDRRDLGLHSTMTATATSKTSNIYYVMCVGARFYEYLAPSEVRNELSSKLVTVTLAS
jgi:hypothetical protein